jgi:hypothetical protein
MTMISISGTPAFINSWDLEMKGEITPEFSRLYCQKRNVSQFLFMLLLSNQKKNSFTFENSMIFTKESHYLMTSGTLFVL